jgi:cytochrome c oxidase subunit 4
MSSEHEHAANAARSGDAGHGDHAHAGAPGAQNAHGAHAAHGHHDKSAGEDDEGHHVVPLRVYFTIFFALMFLTGLTVWVSKIDLGALNTVVALTVAVIKATLVVLFFMHVKYVSKLTQVFAIAGLLWLLILFAFTLQDFISRPWLPV